ncbi:adhesion G protein-coupled receptor E1 [Magallana gigas]|uniref:adhesion G protein-coupled receptor E1 n=1 Tax=Magallana gigas TaxID=29159 RepID=UPI0033410105
MMRAHFFLFLTVALCIQFHYTLSQSSRFYECRDDNDCPRYSRCVDDRGDYFSNGGADYGRCRCDTGYYPYYGDTELTLDLDRFDDREISCRSRDTYSCNQFNNDCGRYGYCEEMQGRYYCRCTNGYYGERCEIPGDGMTRRNQLTNIIPLIGAGVAALVLLGVGGAALSSLSG